MARILSRRANGAPAPAPAPADVTPADQPTVVLPADGTTAAPASGVAVEAPAPEAPAASETPAAPGEEPPAETAVAVDPSLPAGAEPAAPASPSFRDRGKLRRRLRYLRGIREIGFRDLGGLVFDLDRFGRQRPDLIELKLAGLKSIDAELRALEVALDDVHAVEELHEPGLSSCPRCGALHGSEARFCPACGTALDAPQPPVDAPAVAPAESPPAEDPPAAGATDPEQPAA